MHRGARLERRDPEPRGVHAGTTTNAKGSSYTLPACAGLAFPRLPGALPPRQGTRHVMSGKTVLRPRTAYLATLALALFGTACLVTSRDQLSSTFDESNHLAAGLEWWQYGTYTWWTET